MILVKACDRIGDADEVLPDPQATATPSRTQDVGGTHTSPKKSPKPSRHPYMHGVKMNHQIPLRLCPTRPRYVHTRLASDRHIGSGRRTDLETRNASRLIYAIGRGCAA